MTLELSRLFSATAHGLSASEIRELLKLLDRPQMISFAGGLPNPATFPVAELRDVVLHVMADHAREALQYGPTEGHYRLRHAIAAGMGDVYGAPQSVENIVITAGSQQGLHVLASLLLDPGDVVLTGNPTYLGALLTFRALSARVVGVTSDAEGMIVDALRQTLSDLGQQGQRPKFVYLVPTFQNPTGATLGAQRRRQIYEVASQHGLVIIEDDPYGLLRYEGEPVLPIKSLDVEQRVAYLGTFSKILAPGFRIGWIAADPALVRKAVLAKQAYDICANTFGQYCVFEALRKNALFSHIEDIRQLYRHKRDLMLDALAQRFPTEANYRRPEGGLFLWVELPEDLDALELLPKAIEHDVAYVTGRPFHTDGSGHNTLRLNFSYAEDSQIVEGVGRLASVIEAELELARSGGRTDRVGIF
jgi:2-aminoadipate transaminase